MNKQSIRPIEWFYEVVDEVILRWKNENLESLNIAGIDIGCSLSSYLAYELYQYRNKYLKDEIDESFLYKALPFFKHDVTDAAIVLKRFELSDSIMLYANGPRMARQLRPIYDELCKHDKKVFFICEYNVDGIKSSSLNDFPEYFSPLLWSGCKIEKNFFELFKKLLSAFMAIKPACVVCVDGCQTGAKILAEISRYYGSKSVCLQQGWPSFLHSGFRRMPYDKFLTWGNGFSQLYSLKNPGCKFISVGYPYYVVENGEHKAILFCIQAPVYFATIHSLSLFINTIHTTASLYGDLEILVREHPDYRLPDSIKNWLTAMSNIRFVSEDPIERVYAESKIVVAHFSSVLMESMIHGCTPISLDYSGEQEYSPNLMEEGLGYICKNEKDFFLAVESVFNNSYNHSLDIEKWFAPKMQINSATLLL